MIPIATVTQDRLVIIMIQARLVASVLRTVLVVLQQKAVAPLVGAVQMVVEPVAAGKLIKRKAPLL